MFLRIYLGCPYVGETPWIIKKMTNFWSLETCFFFNKLVAGSSRRYFNNSQRKSLVAKDKMKFFWICVWIWICVSNVCLDNNSELIKFKFNLIVFVIMCIYFPRVDFCSSNVNKDRQYLKSIVYYNIFFQFAYVVLNLSPCLKILQVPFLLQED